MGEMGDLWRQHNKERKEKRWDNLDRSLSLLRKVNVKFKSFDTQGLHLLIDERIDFWPTTGRWVVRNSKDKGRGVQQLIKYVVEKAPVKNQGGEE